MGRKRSKKPSESSFARMAWLTAILAIVFSAGLITGQRLLHQQSLPAIPMPSSLSSPSLTTLDKNDATAESPESTGAATKYSFYDQLAQPDARPNIRRAQRRDRGSAAAKATQEDKLVRAVETQRTSDTHDSPPANAHGAKPVDKAQVAEKTDTKTEAPSIEARKNIEPPNEHFDHEPSKSQGQESETPARETNTVLSSDSEKAIAASPSPRYTLQVGVYPSQDIAKQEAEKLRSLGLETHITRSEVPGQGEFFRVRVGRFQSMSESREYQASLRRQNSLNTFVTPY